MYRSTLTNFFFALTVIAVSCTGLATTAFAVEPLQGSGTDVVQYIPYDPPNERQVKFEFSSKEATTIGGSRSAWKGVRIKQFPVTGGKPQMVAETPECFYDQKRGEINSAATLQVHVQDDKFFVEGRGFFLSQSNATLVISNDVHSLLQIQNGTNAFAGPPTEIFAQRARFQMKTDATNGLAAYEGDVRVNDAKMKLRCDSLLADFPKQDKGETNRVNHLVAENNVIIDLLNTNGSPIRATGNRAVYNNLPTGQQTNETLELTGNPRVELTNGWMTADMFTMDRATGKLGGRGNVHIHYLGQNQHPAADLFADRFDWDMNSRLAQFKGNVRLADGRTSMNSEALSAVLPQNASDHIDHVLAETTISMDFVDEKSGQKIHATGQKATYDYQIENGVTNEVLQLTGNPAVQTSKPEGWMTADVILVNRALGRISGIGNHHSVFKKRPNEPAGMDTEIFSDRFDFSTDTGLSIYRDNVRAYDPELNLNSKLLTIKLVKLENGRTNPVDRIVAEGDVNLYFIGTPFSHNDITNLNSFAVKLKQPADAISKFVSAHLSPATEPLLVNYKGGEDVPLAKALTTDLNHLTQQGSIYQKQRFATVELSGETMDLLHQQPVGVEVVQLNRLLLLDAFRTELVRSVGGEKIRARGDRVTYDNKVTANSTNTMLELFGHPELESVQWTLTAEQAIISDRTAGTNQFIGHPHFHTRLNGLAPGKLPATKKGSP